MSCGHTQIPRLQPATLLARITGWSNTPIMSSDVNSVSWSAFRLEEATGEENATDYADEPMTPVTDYVFDSLQLGTEWEEDEIGYNFKLLVPGGVFEERGEIYLIRVTFVMAVGETFSSPFLLEVE